MFWMSFYYNRITIHWSKTNVIRPQHTFKTSSFLLAIYPSMWGDSGKSWLDDQGCKPRSYHTCPCILIIYWWINSSCTPNFLGLTLKRVALQWQIWVTWIYEQNESCGLSFCLVEKNQIKNHDNVFINIMNYSSFKLLLFLVVLTIIGMPLSELIGFSKVAGKFLDQYWNNGSIFLSTLHLLWCKIWKRSKKNCFKCFRWVHGKMPASIFGHDLKFVWAKDWVIDCYKWPVN